MTVATFVISILALVAAAGSTFVAGRLWRIERERDRARRQPKLSAVYEDYGGSHPCLEITNDGDEDLVDLVIELRKLLTGYVPPITSLQEEDGRAADRSNLGGITAAETKRVRVSRDYPEDQYGEAVLYATSAAADGTTWRVTVKADIPEV